MLSIAFALRYRQTFSIGLGMAAELATAGTRSKGVRADIRFTETHGAEGKDVDDVRACFSNLSDLVDGPTGGSQPGELKALLGQIPPEPADTTESVRPLYKRYFRHAKDTAQRKKHGLTEPPTPDGAGKRVKKEEKPAGEGKETGAVLTSAISETPVVPATLPS